MRVSYPEGTSRSRPASTPPAREIALEFSDIDFAIVQAAATTRHRSYPGGGIEADDRSQGGSRGNGSSSDTKQELLATAGNALLRGVSDLRFNFTQPIIDSVTEDTNGTSANLAVGPAVRIRTYCSIWPGKPLPC